GIEFIGNRRVRSDTLQARIFSRKGDPYNEEALRRDFQALWNTKFFEDVKLRVEDSAKNPNGKIIIFEVKERPQIRRIRYDGNHSISESDILDRFKERKVGLTVESQFDPTKIKKAEVVLKELLGEHGRQFAKVTPEYERIASSNAVILVFTIDEGPKVKVGNITIAIEEGERFHMGTLKIVSSDPDKALSLKVDALKTAFPLKQGDIFSTEKVRKALETYGKIYGEYGFIDFTPEPETEVDD